MAWTQSRNRLAMRSVKLKLLDFSLLGSVLVTGRGPSDMFTESCVFFIVVNFTFPVQECWGIRARQAVDWKRNVGF